VRKADNLTTFMCRLLKSGSLDLLEPSGPVQACNGIALPFLHGAIWLINSQYMYHMHYTAYKTQVCSVML